MQQTRETGTTTVGIICKDAVIIGSESKSTSGYLVSSKIAQKIYQVDDRIAVTTAGGAGDTQAIVRMLKAEISLYRNTRNADFTVKAASMLLSNILNSYRYYPYIAMLIIAGYDSSGFHLYTIDPVGGLEEDRYVATGSGSPFAYGVLENDFREGMTKEEGIKLAVRAVRSARERDIYSGGKIVVATIDRSSFEYVSEDKIKELAK